MGSRILGYLPSAAFYILALAAQVSGYTSTTVALSLAAIATLMLMVPAGYQSSLWHNARKSDGRRGLDSWFFIAPCLVIAILAVAGAAYGIGLRSSSNADRKPEVTRPATVAPSKNYFQAEKVELGNLLSDVLSHLNAEGRQAAMDAQRFSSPPIGPQSKHQLMELQSQIDNIRSQTVNLSRALFDNILQRNAKFNYELTQVIGSNSGDNLPLAPFQRALNAYHRDISVFLDQYDQIPEQTRAWILDELFRRDALALSDTASAFNGWLQQCTGRIDDMREALRA